jgi:hypothetical protein
VLDGVLIWAPLVGFLVLAFAAIVIYLGYRWRWTGFGEAALRRDERWEIRPIATVKIIDPGAFVDYSGFQCG